MQKQNYIEFASLNMIYALHDCLTNITFVLMMGDLLFDIYVCLVGSKWVIINFHSTIRYTYIYVQFT